MEPGAGAPNSNSNAGVPSSQQYSGSVGKAPAYVALQPINAPLMQHAIALQQYHFQQSLLNQQLLAQQQAAANAVNIKVAAEEAAARAVQISKFLTGEKSNEEKEKADEPSLNRERSESQSGPHSPSISRSSKSRSCSRSISWSPVRYRMRRSERGRYSSRGFSSYRSQRYHQYGNRGYDDYYSSSHRRDFDRRYHDGDHAYYNRNRGRNRSRSRGSRSLSRSRTERHSLDRSSSHRRGPYRSRSPISDHSTERRLPRVSRSPINNNSLTPSPELSKGTDKRFTGTRSLTPAGSSQNSGGRCHAGSISRDDDDITSVQKNEKQTYRHLEYDISPHGKRLSGNDHSSSSVRSGSISTSHSGEKVMESTKRSPKLSKPSPESGNCSSRNGSDEVVSMSLEANEDENMPSKAGDQYHDQKNSQSQKLSDSGKISADLGALNSRRDKSSEPKDERSPRSEGRETNHRSWHPHNVPDARQSLRPTYHVKDSDYCRKIVAEEQIVEINDKHLLENIKEDSFNSHSTRRDEYAGSRHGKADTSSEAGEDMNMNLLPYPNTAGPGNEKESDELERVDDDLNAQIATEPHRKKRSKRRSKSRDRRSKHGKKRHKKHRRKYSEENLKNHESDRKYHKMLKRERSEEYEKHDRRHGREDPEETEKGHHRKHGRDNSDEDELLEKYKSRRRMKKHSSHRKHKCGYKEKSREGSIKIHLLQVLKNIHHPLRTCPVILTLSNDLSTGEINFLTVQPLD